MTPLEMLHQGRTEGRLQVSDQTFAGLLVADLEKRWSLLMQPRLPLGGDLAAELEAMPHAVESLFGGAMVLYRVEITTAQLANWCVDERIDVLHENHLLSTF